MSIKVGNLNATTLNATAYQLEKGRDNGNIERDALALFLRGVADELEGLEAENERLRLFKSAVDAALDGLYGGNADEIGKPLPIELLPPDRQELFHRVLELLESEETE